jgi:hypothetical protein
MKQDADLPVFDPVLLELAVSEIFVYYSDNRVVEKRTVDVVTFGRTTENLKNCSRWMLIFESRKSKKIGQYAR